MTLRVDRAARRLGGAALLGLAVLGLVGCIKPQVRSQSEEDNERERYGVRTVGDITTVGNADPVPLGGVGLVVGLAGTGGPTPPSSYRTMLENDLKKQRIENVKEVLDSSEHSLVLISGALPPGCRKGDPIDLDITLPPGSKTLSLRGGYLRACQLFNYEAARNLSPNLAGSSKALLGHPVARAEGAVLVGMGEGDLALKSGRIWGGARSNVDIPFHLILNTDQQLAKVASDVASRVNAAFHGGPRSLPGREVATAKNQAVVILGVPPQYRHNLARYLRVVRLVPMREGLSTDNPETPRRPYRSILQDDLLDPARTVLAALRLEALGEESIPALKKGLTSDHALVRFCSAEALAYLGCSACGEELARAVKDQPFLRAFALTAMASLDEAICHVKLKELLYDDLDPETRYGAFRALRALDENAEDVRGECLGDAFHLHQVPGDTRALVHLSLSRRPEVVVFGPQPTLRPPFSLLAGTFAVTSAEEDQRCTISHSDPDQGGISRVRCSLNLIEVFRKLAAQGASYAEILELMRQAENSQCLDCLVRYDALPQAVSVQELVHAGRGEGEEQQGLQLVRPTLEMGVTPTLYERAGKRPADLKALLEKKPAPTPAVGQAKPE